MSEINGGGGGGGSGGGDDDDNDDDGCCWILVLQITSDFNRVKAVSIHTQVSEASDLRWAREL